MVRYDGGLMLDELETVGEDRGFVAECLLPDGVCGDIIETPGGTSVVNEGLAGCVGGLNDSVAYAAGALLGDGEVMNFS